MSGTCLQCGESREAVKRERLSCATLTGGEYAEADMEWPKHRWRPWTDRELWLFALVPEAYEKYRTALVGDIVWAGCEERVFGHLPAEQDDPDLGFKAGRCKRCGKLTSEVE